MLDDTHLQVSFSGNDVTPRAQVETYLLYRAAELTTAKGFDWFEMVDRHTQTTGGKAYAAPYYLRRFGLLGAQLAVPSSRRLRLRRLLGGGGGRPVGTYAVDTIDRFDASAEIVVGQAARNPRVTCSRTDAGARMRN